MHQSEESELTLQEVTMFSVFTQRMTFYLMMLILHHKHFTLPKKKKLMPVRLTITNGKGERD